MTIARRMRGWLRNEGARTMPPETCMQVLPNCAEIVTISSEPNPYTPFPFSESED
jgi:hypothetical protein